MKKLVFGLAILAMGATSCTTTENTATTMNVETSLESNTTMDLVVSDRLVTYTLTPNKAVRAGGPANVRRTAVAEALKTVEGGADVLVAPRYQMVTRRGLFSKKIKSITVSGHPASYKNARPAARCK